MGRNLRYAGLVILAGAAWLLIAVEAKWVPSGLPDMIVPTLAGAGVLCIAAGMVMSAFDPVRRKMLKGRCARCGARTDRGQSYCIDHLRERVSEYQDRTRSSGMHGRGSRA